LVLSGGGAKGAWQVGACQHLIVERGYWFDVIAGVSAGAVNGTALASAWNQAELEHRLDYLRSVWFGLRGSRDIYRARHLGALGMILGGRDGLHDTSPLRGVLDRHLEPSRVATSPIRLRVGYVDLLSGRYRTAGNDDPALVDAVMASCALPIVFPPVPLRNGKELGVDGGVHDSTPLADAVSALPGDRPPGAQVDEVWVLTPDPVRRIPRTDMNHWLGVALRSLCRHTDSALTETVQRWGIKLQVLSPQKGLRGVSLDFDPPRIRAWYEDGLRTAREAGATATAA
jgi:predicted acylesterase/phospholipase RssA